MSREDALRERVKTAKKRPSRKKVWEAPTLADFAHGITVRAFDQSLTSTGWVTIDVTPEEIRVWNRGTIRIAVASKGHTGTMDKADALKLELERVSGLWTELIVGEMTPVVGYRLESSLIAAYVLRQVCYWIDRDVDFVSRQSALALLLPPEKRAEKKYSREVLARYPVRDLNGARWNEHERDALMLALTRLHQIAQEASA